MVERNIDGIPVKFPFEPYEVQHAFMSKVISSLNSETNAVLESPTGTGKTLSLLCSTLAWVLAHKKSLRAQLLKAQPMYRTTGCGSDVCKSDCETTERSDGGCGGGSRNWMMPKIIYASRTHSQLTQAAQEMKRTAYAFMKATVLGSRDQLCIHPEVSQESNNANKVQMCKLKVNARQCTFYTRIESNKNHPDLHETPIMDIEDLVAVGRKLKMCPYYATKELISDADIVFMPYNYLLDPGVRKSNKIELAGSIIILDEAHNIEKICEEYISTQIKSSDLALAIDDATYIMKTLASTLSDGQDGDDDSKDFSLDDVTHFKEILLNLEKCMDDIKLQNEAQGTTYPPSFLYEVLNKANINYTSCRSLLGFCEKLVQYSSMESQYNSSMRKGGSFQKLADFLSVVFISKEEALAKVYRSFKVYVELEEASTGGKRNDDSRKDGGWWGKNMPIATNKKQGRVINYWCFNPGFGMEQLLNARVRSIILTSGTLAPLKPFIAELALPVHQQLENPHIIDSSQVFVKIIGHGPDREPLISNYQNRDNPKYINSLGSTVLNVARIVPDGLLVFFPSYPMLNQCVNSWQCSGVWADISRFKPIFIEPRGKSNFNSVIQDFYASIENSRGGCFMAVCRGKVSEGLDFADRNGRAVIITGLPFPPLMDPKVILKKKYLDENRNPQNELLTGQAWYVLEATRAVNQAIGRVIRHRNDYGAILLCDMRFQQSSQVQQLSKWVRNILGDHPNLCNFGPLVKDLRNFFKNAQLLVSKSIEAVSKEPENPADLQCEKGHETSSTCDKVKLKMTKPQTNLKTEDIVKIDKSNAIETWTPKDYAIASGYLSEKKLPKAMDFIDRLNDNSTTIDFNSTENTVKPMKDVQERCEKRERNSPGNTNDDSVANSPYSRIKKKKYKLTNVLNINVSKIEAIGAEEVPSSTKVNQSEDNPQKIPENLREFLKILRETLSSTAFNEFTDALVTYKNDQKVEILIEKLFKILSDPNLSYILQGMRRFIKTEHREEFDRRLALKLNS